MTGTITRVKRSQAVVNHALERSDAIYARGAKRAAASTFVHELLRDRDHPESTCGLVDFFELSEPLKKIADRQSKSRFEQARLAFVETYIEIVD